METNALAEVLGQQKAYSEIAIALLVAALAQQPSIDGTQLKYDFISLLTPQNVETDQFETLRTAIEGLPSHG